jgi:long-chain acyl-CoA synthetase
VFVIAENGEQLQKLRSQRAAIPRVKKVIVIDGFQGQDDWALSLADLEELGKRFNKENPKALEAIIDAVSPDRLATLIYTSGTTGRPKGVALTHDCWCYEGLAMAQIGTLVPEDKQYLWLPLSHSFGKVLEVACLQVGLPTAIDGRIDKIVDNLGVIRPTFMAAAPRIFEKVYNRVVTGAREAGGIKLAIFQWAVPVGMRVSKLRQQGKEPTGLLALQYRIADKLVFSKLRARFGGRIRCFVSGSAPLNRDMAEFFHAAGLLILEGYGLTETSAASFVNRTDNYAFGTVGIPVPGTEVKIAESDGEILLRGRGIMRGYWKLPEITAETIDADGWLHTGDIGELDAEGPPQDHGPQEGSDQDVGRQVRGTPEARVASQGAQHLRVAGRRPRRRASLLQRAHHARRRGAREMGAANGKGDRTYAELVNDPEVRRLVQPRSTR